MKKQLLVLSVSCALAVTSASAAINWSFMQADQDGNRELSRQEFLEGLREANIFATFDPNGDNALQENEFYEHAFGAWDVNNDNIVDPLEFNTYSGPWFTAGVAGTFDDWDDNEDGAINLDEFVAEADDEGLFDEWDENDDGALAENEYVAAAFERADIDRDQVVSEDEDAIWFNWV